MSPLTNVQLVLFLWAAPLILWPDAQLRQQYRVNVCSHLIVAVMDCCEQYVVTSKNITTEKSCFSGKYMDHSVTLLVACHPVTGRVLMVSASDCGSKNDQQVMNETSWENRLSENEFILADKGFSGPRVLTKHRKDQNTRLSAIQVAENAEIDKFRIIIENVFAWVQTWRICADKLRYKSSNITSLLYKHNRNWIIVCAILNAFSAVRK